MAYIKYPVTINKDKLKVVSHKNKKAQSEKIQAVRVEFLKDV